MDSNSIPIDIQCNKLVDWLIDRRHCNIKWKNANEVVKEKIINALKDMPGTPEMLELVSGSCFHYFKCKQIVELLRDTEKDSKNIFGRYSSQRMKDWLEILKLYENENLLLAELSSRFIRNLNYEIPSVKRQIAKCQQVQEDTVLKDKDIDRNIKEVHRKYEAECKKMGIVGKQVKHELLQLVTNLPEEFDKIAANITELNATIQFYSEFTGFSLGENGAFDVCPLLKYVAETGNTTVYQWKTGKVPREVIKDRQSVVEAEIPVAETDIDWGVPEIDFGIEVDSSDIVIEGESGDNGFEIVEPADLSDQISWDIEEIKLEEVPNGSKVVENIATGSDALKILEFMSTRNQIINELRELQGFLTQRVVESKLEEDFLSISQFQFAPTIVQMQTLQDVYKMESLVNSVHHSLTTSRMKDLCKILDSPKYVDRLTGNLKRQLALTDKYHKMKLQCSTERDDAALEAQKLKPVLQDIIVETKEWQGLIEQEISKWYKNRKINLVGTINTL